MKKGKLEKCSKRKKKTIRPEPNHGTYTCKNTGSSKVLHGVNKIKKYKTVDFSKQLSVARQGIVNPFELITDIVAE